MLAACPQAEVEAVVEMYTEEREEALLCGSPDYVIDAIDNIDTKVSAAGGVCLHSPLTGCPPGAP